MDNTRNNNREQTEDDGNDSNSVVNPEQQNPRLSRYWRDGIITIAAFNNPYGNYVALIAKKRPMPEDEEDERSNQAAKRSRDDKQQQDLLEKQNKHLQEEHRKFTALMDSVIEQMQQIQDKIKNKNSKKNKKQ